MKGRQSIAIGVGIVALVVAWTPLHADLVHLRNGHRLQVDGWRQAGDGIEFMIGGGIVGIAHAEVQRVDGTPSQGDFFMYATGVAAARSADVDTALTAVRMSDLLGQGEALFGQSILQPAEKSAALRRLVERWRELEVPDELRPVHGRAEAAIQTAIEAVTAGGETVETGNRADQARAELRAVRDELRKRGLGVPDGDRG